MMDKGKYIKELLPQIIEDNTVFVIDLVMKGSNKVILIVDTHSGITLAQCAEINKRLSEKINEDKLIDIEIEVSSPGISAPFKTIQQYEKNIGNELEIIDEFNEKRHGVLKAIRGNEIDIETKTKIAKNKTINEIKTYNLTGIKLAKRKLNF